MNKNSATLRLTEPVIFLRCGIESASRRRRADIIESPPALLRAILTLKLVKPTRVTSIDVTFEGVSKTDWPDLGGIAARRMEIHEDNTFLSSKIVLFQAVQQKRSRTVGPGSYMDDRRSRSMIENPIGGRRARRESADLEAFRRGPLAALNGPDEAGHAGPSNDEWLRARPRLDQDATDVLRPADSALHASRPLAPSPVDTPPLYSSVVSSNKPGAADFVDPRPLRRRSARLSLSGMLNDMRGMVQGHPSRHNIENEVVIPQPPLERQESDEADGRGRKEKGPIARLGEAFGIDMNDDDDKSADDDPNWKELKPGSYNYPISFTLPSDLPPSIETDYGSVVYKLKAAVHRPGAFSTKIAASTVVELVSAPAEDDTEDGEPVVVERQWEMELRYLISISGRNLPQGVDVPWHVQLLPLSKSKLHRLTFLLEEKIDYVVGSHQLTRSETVRRFQLLSIRHPQSLSNQKEVARRAPALLPIWSGESSQSSEAVLLPYADPPSTDIVEQTTENQETEALAHLLNPTGPWHLSGTLTLPLNHLHTTHRRHDQSFVSIKHVLKVIMRVERGDNESVDPKTNKKKQFDIIVETPVNILSKYCRRDWASLPRYENLDPPPTTDPGEAEERENIPASRDSSTGHINTIMSAVVSPATSRPHTPHGDSPRGSGPNSPIEPIEDPLRCSRMQTSQRFASLMAGFEDEGGELPPTYQSVTVHPASTQSQPQSPMAPPEARLREDRSGSRRNVGSRSSSRTPDRGGTTLLFHIS